MAQSKTRQPKKGVQCSAEPDDSGKVGFGNPVGGPSISEQFAQPWTPDPSAQASGDSNGVWLSTRGRSSSPPSSSRPKPPSSSSRTRRDENSREASKFALLEQDGSPRTKSPSTREMGMEMNRARGASRKQQVAVSNPFAGWKRGDEAALFRNAVNRVKPFAPVLVPICLVFSVVFAAAMAIRYAQKSFSSSPKLRTSTPKLPKMASSFLVVKQNTGRGDDSLCEAAGLFKLSDEASCKVAVSELQELLVADHPDLSFVWRVAPVNGCELGSSGMADATVMKTEVVCGLCTDSVKRNLLDQSCEGHEGETRFSLASWAATPEPALVENPNGLKVQVTVDLAGETYDEIRKTDGEVDAIKTRMRNMVANSGLKHVSNVEVDVSPIRLSSDKVA